MLWCWMIVFQDKNIITDIKDIVYDYATTSAGSCDEWNGKLIWLHSVDETTRFILCHQRLDGMNYDLLLFPLFSLHYVYEIQMSIWMTK